MTPERHHQIRDVFNGAIALPEVQRAEFLSMSCGSDAEIRTEVEALLACHDEADRFLESPAVAIMSPESEDAVLMDVSGRRIGRYELKKVIAAGGMGIVYEALQDQPRRTVALKVMRERLATRSALRRFQYEAEILGRLRHPNIAQIFEAGTYFEESSREGGEATPYFAMEFIPNARSISDDAQQRNLPLRDRLSLFAKVCDAVHHGHQKGVIHRDLKPANILVGADGEPKVIDFGVARATDSDIALTTQQTHTGQLIGTVQYMSPEQCDGVASDLDSRTDVYSLGAVLYELLAGSPAFDLTDATIYSATRIIKETIPPALSSINRRFKGDLETIVAKAMDKDRTRRYQSAEALRKDIERHLNGEPIEARRQSTWVRVTRWMGKHPLASAGAGATTLALLILGVTIGFVWYGNSHPIGFWIGPEARVARLLTPFSKVLTTLGDESAGYGNVKVELVDRPARFGGGRVALFSVKEGEHSTEQQLWMCELDNFDKPLWQTRPEKPQACPRLPESWRTEPKPSDYYIHDFLVCNAIQETPENEIVVVHAHAEGSRQSIRIYDFAGEVLFEVWHLGRISDIHWWKEAGLLVGAGDRHGRPDLEQHGYPNPPPYPKIVFAIRPRSGLRVTTWLNARDWKEDVPIDPNLANVLAWYKSLPSLNWSAKFTPTQIFGKSLDLDSFVDVYFDSTIIGATFTLRVNLDGDVVDVIGNDQFNQTRNSFPQDDPTLVDWPPLDSPPPPPTTTTTPTTATTSPSSSDH